MARLRAMADVRVERKKTESPTAAHFPLPKLKLFNAPPQHTSRYNKFFAAAAVEH